MAQSTLKLTITFDALLESIRELSLDDKNRLLELLEEWIGHEEEALLEQDPEIRTGIEQAYVDYEAGDYLTIEDYMAQRKFSYGL